MIDSANMDPAIWPTEDEISSEVVLEHYRRLRRLNTMSLIEKGIPGIKPPEVED